MPLPIIPALPNYLFYDPVGTPIAMELISPLAIPSLPYVGFIGQEWQFSQGQFPPPGVMWPVYTPPGAWGLQADGVTSVDPAGVRITSIDVVTATENQDGSGTSYDLTAETFLQGPQGDITDPLPTLGVQYLGPVAFGIHNTHDRTLYVQSVRMTGYRLYKLDVANQTTPTSTGTGGNALDAANPGFVVVVERSVHFWGDLTSVFLGDRVNLEIESEGQRAGFHARGHIITIEEMDYRSELQGGVKVELIDWTYTLEKIPGTLLPGTGTSTPAQDALGTGAEIPLFAVISTSIPTIGVANLE